MKKGRCFLLLQHEVTQGPRGNERVLPSFTRLENTVSRDPGVVTSCPSSFRVPPPPAGSTWDEQLIEIGAAEEEVRKECYGKISQPTLICDT